VKPCCFAWNLDPMRPEPTAARQTRSSFRHLSMQVVMSDSEVVNLSNRTSTCISFGMLSVMAAVFVAVFLLVGCNTQAKHADVKDAVDQAMTRNDLGVVKVSQDRDKGVLTLTGDVDSDAKKAQAETVAKQTAPDYAVANELAVRPPTADNSQEKAVDKNLDKGIEDNFKAELKAHKNLDDQSIHYDAKNGTLVLKGSVKTAAQKQEAMKLAKHIPNVKEVVNEIEVKSDKNTSASAQ
jgi:hyperosmotically inducible protein